MSQQPLPADPDESEHQLDGELKDLLEQAGEARYFEATARHFATGGRFNPKPKRPRYALTE